MVWQEQRGKGKSKSKFRLYKLNHSRLSFSHHLFLPLWHLHPISVTLHPSRQSVDAYHVVRRRWPSGESQWPSGKGCWPSLPHPVLLATPTHKARSRWTFQLCGRYWVSALSRTLFNARHAHVVHSTPITLPFRLQSNSLSCRPIRLCENTTFSI